MENIIYVAVEERSQVEEFVKAVAIMKGQEPKRTYVRLSLPAVLRVNFDKGVIDASPLNKKGFGSFLPGRCREEWWHQALNYRQGFEMLKAKVLAFKYSEERLGRLR